MPPVANNPPPSQTYKEGAHSSKEAAQSRQVKDFSNRGANKMPNNETLDMASIKRRLEVIEQILERHAKIFDPVYLLHGQKKGHWIETRQVPRQK